jgi:hypothetical protein
LSELFVFGIEVRDLACFENLKNGVTFLGLPRELEAMKQLLALEGEQLSV